jgi:hypothetical protein
MWAAVAALIFGAGAAGAAPFAQLPAAPLILASQGNAKAGKTCMIGGSGNRSAAIGMPLDGLPDTPGPNGNEANNIFLITDMPMGSAGSGTHLGFLVTTFNQETFYQFPVWVPGKNTAVVLNLGKLAIRPNEEMPAAAWLDVVNHALALSRPMSGYVKAAHDAAKTFQVRVGRSGTVTISSCFEAPWNGGTS